MNTNIKRKRMGARSRARGKAFELKVRVDLENKGWIVFRNSNDVKEDKFIQTTGHWNPFTHTIMVSQSGFPDFVCIRKFDEEENFMDTGAIPNGKGLFINAFEVEFVECKSGKTGLDKAEKAKCEWIKNNFHIPIVLATQEKIGRKKEIKYTEIN